MELWTDKHKPMKIEELVGNSKALEKILEWVSSFKPGKAAMLYGPTGVGKSLVVEILAKTTNSLLSQLNANDVSKESVEEIIRSSKNRTIFNQGRIILIDEIEGISGRDRGVMDSIIRLVKESKYPVFLIASDPYLPKLRSVKEYCELVKFDKVAIPSISKALRDIAKKEGIEPEEDALKSLAKFSGGDLRSAIIDLQIACTGRKQLTSKDLESIGYREREQGVFNILQPIFHSRSVNVGRNSLNQADKDPDDVFWWIENNLLQELKTHEEIEQGYNLLSVADIFRNRTIKQQNWRFKALAGDLMASISVFKTSHTGFVMYRPPQRFAFFAKSKESKEAMVSLGKKLHCSSRIVKNSYMPYLRTIIKSRPDIASQLEIDISI